jgi:hypothetical protein
VPWPRSEGPATRGDRGADAARVPGTRIPIRVRAAQRLRRPTDLHGREGLGERRPEAVCVHAVQLAGIQAVHIAGLQAAGLPATLSPSLSVRSQRSIANEIRISGQALRAPTVHPFGVVVGGLLVYVSEPCVFRASRQAPCSPVDTWHRLRLPSLSAGHGLRASAHGDSGAGAMAPGRGVGRRPGRRGWASRVTQNHVA